MMYHLYNFGLVVPVASTNDTWMEIIYATVAISFPFLFTWYIKKAEAKEQQAD